MVIERDRGRSSGWSKMLRRTAIVGNGGEAGVRDLRLK
jgi:hypothetical protein